jgi:hypothetical protein
MDVDPFTGMPRMMACKVQSNRHQLLVYPTVTYEQ